MKEELSHCCEQRMDWIGIKDVVLGGYRIAADLR